MMAKLRGGVALAGAQIIDLAAWRAGRRPESQPVFVPTDRPGIDFNDIGHVLEAAARYVCEGRMGAQEIAKLLEGLSVNAHAACRVGHDLEFRVRVAERLLRPQMGGLEGKALERAIWKASKAAAAQERRDAKRAEWEGRGNR